VGDLVTEIAGGKQPYRGIIPEGVATGATLMAGVLASAVKDVLLLDVTPMSLGVETTGGVMHKLIERNTTIPTIRSEVYTTREDDQPALLIRVREGEREKAADNRRLVEFELTGIPKAPRGVPQIEIRFDIDANGTLHAQAKDLGTGNETSITVNRESVRAPFTPSADARLPAEQLGAPPARPPAR
jgi:molecular chaperone DnaK